MKQVLAAPVLLIALGGSAVAPLIPPEDDAPHCPMCNKDCCCAVKARTKGCGHVRLG